MARTKIDYGIDLGTTNSAIARMENGNPVIKKSKLFQMDTTPSCVWFNRKGMPIVGTNAKNELSSERISAFAENNKSLVNAFEEFKRTMGSDITYDSKNTGRSFSSEELSGEVLKALKGYIQDEDINSIIITIPDRFEQHSVDATQRTAELAGFQYCELLSEPTAASMAFGMSNREKDGAWLVFDFGGGTFDVVIMESKEGIIKQIGSSGDNKLGGKNIDDAIIDHIIIPYIQEKYNIDSILSDDKRKDLLRKAVKKNAEETKINLSSKDDNQFNIMVDEPIGIDDAGNKIEIDLTITKEQFEDVAKSSFQRSIDITKKLLEKYNLNSVDVSTVLMIGGTTFSETLREMVRKQISPNINILIDPMTAVCVGAALFASTRNIPDDIRETDKSKAQLKLTYTPDEVESEANVGISLQRDKTEGDLPDKIFIQFDRQDDEWSSGKFELKGDSEIVEVQLEQGKSNLFSIIVLDENGKVFPCEPESFSILGIKAVTARLPYDLCIDAFEFSKGKHHLIPLKGLEEGASLPAKGKGAFKSMNDLRPGKKEDVLHISVYNGKPRTKHIYANHAGTGIIIGENLPGYLPKDSDIEITLKVDESRRITLSASFPSLDDHMHEETFEHFIQETPDINILDQEIKNVKNSLAGLEDDDEQVDTLQVEKVRTNIEEINDIFSDGKNDEETRIRILERIRELNKEIEKLKTESEWPNVLQELTESLKELETTIEQYGNEQAKSLLSQMNSQVKSVIEKQDINMAKDLTSRIMSMTHEIIRQEHGPAYWISFIKWFDDAFDTHDWTDRNQARQLINDAKSIINANRAAESNLQPIVGQLYQLHPRGPISTTCPNCGKEKNKCTCISV